MELRVNDYVRTKDGYVAKIESIEDDIYMCDKIIGYVYEPFTSFGEANKEIIVKSSPNIIDLIEVGDYVNGWKVTQITNSYVEICWGRDSDEFIKPENIKSIVTKEQFSQMKYRIGE